MACLLFDQYSENEDRHSAQAEKPVGYLAIPEGLDAVCNPAFLNATNERFGHRAKHPIIVFDYYLSADETDEKVVFSFVPRPCTTAMIATEMPAAISPYSMAVAAVSSLRKPTKKFFIASSFWSPAGPMTVR